MKVFNEEEKQLIQNLLEQKIPRKEIAKRVHVRWDVLKKYLDSINAPKIKLGIPLEYYDSIKELYLLGLTSKEIHEQHYPQFTVDQIGYVCKTLGISRRNGKRTKMNHNYFQNIDSEEKAYWLGLLTADGCIQRHLNKGLHSWSISLSLNPQDRYLVEKFAEAVQTNLKVKDYTNNTGFQKKDGTPHIESRIVLHSEKMALDLQQYNVIPNKSLLLTEVPDIPNELIRHYIRGFFDGNGTITYYTSHGRHKPRIAIYSTHNFCDSLQNCLCKELNIQKHKIVDQKNYKVSYIYYCVFDDIEKIYHYFYDDTNLYITRKKEKMEELIGEYRDNYIA